MKEAIKRVIAELEEEHKRNWKLERLNIPIEQQHYRQGGQDGLSFAIDKLKEVLREHEDTGKEDEVRSAEDDR